MTEDEVNRTLGARIKQVRQRRGWSQQRVARGYRGKSWAAQSHYEAGQRAVSVYRLLQLSEILGIEPTAWLLEDGKWNQMLDSKYPMEHQQ